MDKENGNLKRSSRTEQAVQHQALTGPELSQTGVRKSGAQFPAQMLGTLYRHQCLHTSTLNVPGIPVPLLTRSQPAKASEVQLWGLGGGGGDDNPGKVGRFLPAGTPSSPCAPDPRASGARCIALTGRGAQGSVAAKGVESGGGAEAGGPPPARPPAALRS